MYQYILLLCQYHWKLRWQRLQRYHAGILAPIIRLIMSKMLVSVAVAPKAFWSVIFLSFSCYCGRYPFVVPRISATAYHQYFLFWWRQISSPKPGFQLCRAVSWLFRCCARGPSLCSLPRLILLMAFSKVPRGVFIAVRAWMRCCDGFKGCLEIGG